MISTARPNRPRFESVSLLILPTVMPTVDMAPHRYCKRSIDTQLRSKLAKTCQPVLTSKLALDPSSVHHQQLVQHLYADIESCRGLLRLFLDRLTAAHSPLQHISMIFSPQRDLAEFRTKLGWHQESLRTWQTTLILASAQKISIGVQRLGSRVEHVGHDLRGLDLASNQEISTNVERLGSRVEHVGRDLKCLGRNLGVYREMVLNVPHGVLDDMIIITDYTGGKIHKQKH
ncbi:hypothetical protein DFH09DRAFT_1488805 [Mycena vulgaris]|nr:hypothetical protein DFH09DRAFT_1488805 [Mycena vulgaris]